MNQTTAKLVEALTLAQCALNTAPRFKVGDTDSYRIAVIVGAALAATRADTPATADLFAERPLMLAAAEVTALRHLVYYAIPEEARHWHEMGEPSNHVYHDLRVLTTAIERLPQRADTQADWPEPFGKQSDRDGEDASAGGMNAKRAGWANTALERFMQDTGADYEDSLGDLLADLMHWARQNNFDFDAAIARATEHFRIELIEDN